MFNPSNIKQQLTKTHLIEFITATILFVVGMILEELPGYHMEIPLERNNAMVLYKNLNSTIPSILCLIISISLPITVIFLFAKKRNSTYYFITVFIVFFFSFSMNIFLTNVIKLFAGRPRPNFYAMIDAGNMKDAYKSFPSGHSSMMFNGMMFISLLLCGELHVFNGNGSLLTLLLSLLPLVMAGIVAVTRTRDYFHNFDDILAGSIIGSIISLLSYITKFKSLWGQNAGEIEEEVNLEFDNNYNYKKTLYN
ncbi:lipid phosphate phosphatase [Entamoeba histolytica HM-3:IMSS]|uniref:Lipid phosphate phosphatase n=1 Tax=Entamoeba histolytica HM-3:IMSS TaxID=885315 RepID=M7WV76_ENTHI|nr:lipid phosphate phosphatase [Entamoeba histolytica HM-3:IMSS]